MNNTLVGRVVGVSTGLNGNLEISLDSIESNGQLSMIVCEINSFAEPVLQKWAKEHLKYDHLIWVRLWTQRKILRIGNEVLNVNVTYVKKIEIREEPRI